MSDDHHDKNVSEEEQVKSEQTQTTEIGHKSFKDKYLIHIILMLVLCYFFICLSIGWPIVPIVLIVVGATQNVQAVTIIGIVTILPAFPVFAVLMLIVAIVCFPPFFIILYLVTCCFCCKKPWLL